MSIAKSDYIQQHGTTDGLAVVTHSSGNHAMALALAAKTFRVPAHIVMPKSSPRVKQQSVRGYGGTITLCEHPTEEVSIHSKSKWDGGSKVHKQELDSDNNKQNASHNLFSSNKTSVKVM